MRYLEALYALDYDVRTNGGPQGGFFLPYPTLLMLSLRLEVRKGLDGEEYIPIGIQTEKDNPRKLTALEVTQGEVSVEITPQNFVQLREILAAQNEVELPDETLNAELVQAERDLATKSSLNLVPDSEALIYSVSVKTQIPVEDIFQWTVRRFVLTERAIDRITGHLVAALSGGSGEPNIRTVTRGPPGSTTVTNIQAHSSPLRNSHRGYPVLWKRDSQST